MTTKFDMTTFKMQQDFTSSLALPPFDTLYNGTKTAPTVSHSLAQLTQGLVQPSARRQAKNSSHRQDWE